MVRHWIAINHRRQNEARRNIAGRCVRNESEVTTTNMLWIVTAIVR